MTSTISEESKVSARLSRAYDASLLQNDLSALSYYKFAPQPGLYHKGEWVGISLVAPGGKWNWAASSLLSLETSHETEITKYTPYFKQIIDGFQCPLMSVRLLALPPGGKIGEHCDDGVGFNTGILRLHIPIVTHPDVVFFLGGERMRWNVGELWFGDFSQPHSVENHSPVTRYHMVLDVGVNEFLLGLFPESFIERALSQEFKHIEPSIELSHATLESFICAFNIPLQMLRTISSIILMRDAAGQQARVSPGNSADWREKDGLGDIRLLDGKLILFVEGKPFCALDPLPGDKFRVVGMPKLVLKFEKNGERVSSIRVAMGDQLLAILPVS